MASGSTAMLRRAAQDSLCQASAEHLQQCAEFLPLRNRGLGPLAVTVLPIPLARRAGVHMATPGLATLLLLKKAHSFEEDHGCRTACTCCRRRLRRRGRLYQHCGTAGAAKSR